MVERRFANEIQVYDEDEFVNLAKDFTNATKWFTEPINEARVGFNADDKAFTINGKNKYILNVSGKCSLPARAVFGVVTINDTTKHDWVSVMNTCLPYRTGNMILNELEGEVYAAHSDQYSVISIDDIMESAKTILHAKFPNIKFLYGSISPEFTMCEYSLASEESVVKTYEKALNENFERSLRLVSPTIRICTSNTSDSGANIYPCLVCKGEQGELYTIVAGLPLKAIHKGETGMRKVRENLGMTMDMIEKSAENFVRLTYIAINNPKQCFLNIAKRLSLPKPAAMEVAEEIGEMFNGKQRTTAKFIYLSLVRILEKVERKSEKDKWDLVNQIAHAMTIDYSAYDTKSCDWLKKDKDTNQISLF